MLARNRHRLEQNPLLNWEVKDARENFKELKEKGLKGNISKSNDLNSLDSLSISMTYYFRIKHTWAWQTFR